MSFPARQIRATYTADTVTVYQAYPAPIADAATAGGRFVPPFKRDRMTWVKPSFLWMMYRCGWATKPDQERVLAIEISRAGFEWALAHACLSSFDSSRHPSHESWRRALRESAVRVQWDPERSIRMQPLPYRSVQLGLSGTAVDRYVDEWTVAITDVTPMVTEIRDRIRAGAIPSAEAALPSERPYPLPPALAIHIGATTVDKR